MIDLEEPPVLFEGLRYPHPFSFGRLKILQPLDRENNIVSRCRC